MKNIYDNLEDLAKSVKAQNLFIAAKEINGIRLFRNSFDFSKIQEIYLSDLYNFDVINRDIILEKISKHVLDNKIYWDSYLIYKRKNMKKINIKDNKIKEVSLITGKKINFPKR
jgi:hypothetical protein